jgi:hypothetical protein
MSPYHYPPAFAVFVPFFRFDVKKVMETTFLSEPGPF